MTDAPETVICRFSIRAGRVEEFLELVRNHWPTLRRHDLVTDRKPLVFRGSDKGGGEVVFEIFEWRNAGASSLAHETPEILAVWEPMGKLVEERGGRPAMEFPHVQSVALEHTGSWR